VLHQTWASSSSGFWLKLFEDKQKRTIPLKSITSVNNPKNRNLCCMLQASPICFWLQFAVFVIISFHKGQWHLKTKRKYKNKKHQTNLVNTKQILLVDGNITSKNKKSDSKNKKNEINNVNGDVNLGSSGFPATSIVMYYLYFIVFRRKFVLV
jgi:hypothetical protein